MVDSLFWTVVGFISGSIPISLILGKVFAKTDIRSVGDGNPGAANALKAGGLKIGIPAIILDIAKGFLPVYFAQRYGLTGWELVPVALAPALGHVFSPFLKFHGGKALAATGGAWIALIGPKALVIYAILAVPFTIFQTENGWSANAGMLALLGYAVLVDGSPWLIAFAALNSALIAGSHWKSLSRPMQLRGWVVHLFSEKGA